MLATHALLFINKGMTSETEFNVTDAPMAKLLSVILIIGQWILALGFICLILMAAFMLIPGDFRDDLIADLPSDLPSSTLAGRCLASAAPSRRQGRDSWRSLFAGERILFTHHLDHDCHDRDLSDDRYVRDWGGCDWREC